MGRRRGGKTNEKGGGEDGEIELNENFAFYASFSSIVLSNII